uniref:C-C motif chemokine n=1 Tax=Paramormyrops kingsleyae TaxID=1676925 RepID=A0A3B3R8C6_9TELE
MYIFRAAVYILYVACYTFSVLHISPDGSGLDQCCFTYFPGRLRMDLIVGYVETSMKCPEPGIILYTKKGNEVCVDPRAHWVQGVKKRLDQTFFQ